MRQLDIHKYRYHRLGAFLHTLKSSMSIFGILMFFIGLYGWHQLVFVRLVPNFWVFLGLFVSVFMLFSLLQYFILTPLEVAFINEQSKRHDPRNGGET